MAGKTFPGIGDLEDESLDPADAADSGATPAPSGPYYSGPTVVDDAKVEASLQQMRSLDAPLTEVTGPEDSARELVESGAHQMPSFPSPALKDGGRGTFIGHSVATPLPQPPAEKPFDDRMRGTLYGHMLHLPELNLPAPEEPSSRELTIVDRSAPTSHAVEVYQPEGAYRAGGGVPQEAEAFPRSDRYRSIPIEIETETEAKNKTFMRVGIAAAALAAVVGAAIIWVHTSTDEPEAPARPAALARPAPPPAPATAPIVVPTTPSSAPAAAPPAPPTAETAQPEAPAPKAVRDGLRPSTERARTLTVRPATTPPPTPAARPEHHRSGGSAEAPAASRPKAPKPQHPAATEEDPDGTLAPTIQ